MCTSSYFSVPVFFSFSREPFKQLTSLLLISLALSHCANPSPAPNLPPSQSDLKSLGRENLCQTRSGTGTSLTRGFQATPWGSGIELYQHKRLPEDQHQWLMFNEDGILVGAVTIYSNGLSLDPYPQLHQTLSQLPPSKEFFLNSSQILQEENPDSAILFRTGEATTTHQYVIRKRKNQDDQLVMTVFLLDPYERLFEDQHQRFLAYATSDGPTNPVRPQTAELQNTPANEFLGLQQFARGELSLFGSCGTKNPDIAVDAYRQALKLGLPDKSHQAEAYHRIGLALKSLGKLEDAKLSLERALTLQPHSPTILNSYGTILAGLKQLPQAMQAYEQALALKPDYAHARFNLAEAFELVNPKRALQEYETFLSLAEENPQEFSKVQLAKQKIQALQNGHR